MACKTTIAKGAVDDTVATSLYERLRDTVEWVEGIRSRKDSPERQQLLKVSSLNLLYSLKDIKFII